MAGEWQAAVRIYPPALSLHLPLDQEELHGCDGQDGF